MAIRAGLAITPVNSPPRAIFNAMRYHNVGFALFGQEMAITMGMCVAAFLLLLSKCLSALMNRPYSGAWGKLPQTCRLLGFLFSCVT
ncbi:MAG: hypothetical protein FWG82_01015 [Oscillospiraceae bacterium]|nr:hypothetical protein [Oscillospiraceae bacterium]